MIRFGFIGTGAMASRMVQTLRHCRVACVTTVASASRNRAIEFANGHAIPTAAASIDALLSNPEIDAVYLANRNDDHFQVALQALSRSVPVLIEKPLALNALQTNEILALAKSKGILAMEAIWIAFLPSIRTAMTEAQTGKFGTPYLLRADFGYPISPEQVASAMRQDSGVLMDRLVYPLSMAVSLMGNVERVTIGGLMKTNNVDTDAILHVEHSNGGISQMAISFNKIFDNEAVLYCEKGSIKISSPLLGSESIAINQWQPPDLNNMPGPVEPRTESTLKLKLKQMPLFRQLNQKSNRLPLSKHSFGADQFLPMINHFANLLADGKSESPIVSHHLSKEIARAVDLAKSLKH